MLGLTLSASKWEVWKVHSKNIALWPVQGGQAALHEPKKKIFGGFYAALKPPPRKFCQCRELRGHPHWEVWRANAPQTSQQSADCVSSELQKYKQVAFEHIFVYTDVQLIGFT
jgi:hypothetical protein